MTDDSTHTGDPNEHGGDNGDEPKRALNVPYEVEDIIHRLNPWNRRLIHERDVITEYNTRHIPSPRQITLTKTLQLQVKKLPAIVLPTKRELLIRGKKALEMANQRDDEDDSDKEDVPALAEDATKHRLTMYDLFMNRPPARFKSDMPRRHLNATLRESVSRSSRRVAYCKKGGLHWDETFQKLNVTAPVDPSTLYIRSRTATGGVSPNKHGKGGSTRNSSGTRTPAAIMPTPHSQQRQQLQQPSLSPPPPTRPISAAMRAELGAFISKCDEDECPMISTITSSSSVISPKASVRMRKVPPALTTILSHKSSQASLLTSTMTELFTPDSKSPSKNNNLPTTNSTNVSHSNVFLTESQQPAAVSSSFFLHDNSHNEGLKSTHSIFSGRGGNGGGGGGDS
eukprot:PhF_6_TR32980/c0_g1_i1/m.48574